MITSRTRLDRYLSSQLKINRRDVRLMLAQARVRVDQQPATEIHQVIDRFSRVEVDGELLSAARPVYIMLNKPAGIVSATSDEQHRTVLELLPKHLRENLHLVGRLDYNSTGLVLLTNDGQWSRTLTLPETKVSKRYRVHMAKPITEHCVRAFAEGMYFPYEGITTRPAKLSILSSHEAEVILEEGRYHQIKRMFGRFQNEVLELHREAVGAIELDPGLSAGQWRFLNEDEIRMPGILMLKPGASLTTT
ncbi:16S rRNA pseudouridine(516) synthase [Pseudomaricurvus alkylphenolicus]|jgi:16S rRNA pseudouridine516 synthase|uniref:pseudouridine synthase n=1 Tax=Pseudomaricurvus alkylphenolicus TaxID=1306991 RepID=UPI00141E7155|nr:16S rRNA pseudouridine(516) synthase [Pseudomaricurvus alkylphenolicus]NIB41492.1 16S rRNA pseudouridine(516) synthase [Pseudomaricurvus alkylphenolicus]